MKKTIYSIAASSAVIIACYARGAETDITVKIDPGKTFQTIDGFAASDAWSGNFIGKFFAEDKKEKLAKWLFSQKYGEDGSPEGIGLSTWRVNLGGGTWEQEGADIIPFQRRAESFLSKDGKSYDWSKAAGQQYFMKKAKEYGCESFLLFSNTPPVQMTQNGKGYKDAADFKSNLRADCYDDFAEYMAEVAKHFTGEGYAIDYISPVNEPGWKWSTNAQEGTPWLNPEIKRLAVELDKSLNKRGLKTKQLLCEAERIDYLYGSDAYLEGRRKINKNPAEDMACDHIRAFFDPDSKEYIGHLKSLPRKIGAHDYHTHTSNEQIVSTRKKLKECADKYGVQFIQTEWCLLPGVACKDGMPQKNPSDMDISFLMAKLIHTDLAHVDAPSWGYWKAFEINGDHALTGVYPKDGDICQGGNVFTRKKLWTLGNYSFFIRPGWKRIELTGADDLGGVFASAFASPDGRKVAVVAANASYEPADFDFSLSGKGSDGLKKVSAFRTSESSDLANQHIDPKFDGNRKFRLAPRSVTTLLFE